jgi:DNA-binding MarR family transcriptional regulator
LEKSGWVRRTDDPADRRVYRVVLTPAGRALWSKVTPLYLEVVTQITRGLSAKRLQDGLDLLKTLEAGATNWELPNR